MNDRQDPYGLGDPPQTSGYIYGYDEYGRPVYAEPPQQVQHGYDTPYAQDPGTGQQPAYGAYDSYGPYHSGTHAPHGYAPDTYADPHTPAPDSHTPDAYAPDGYAPDGYAAGPGTGQQPAYDPYGPYPPQDTSTTGGQPPVTDAWIPQQSQVPWYEEGHGGQDQYGRPSHDGASPRTGPAPAPEVPVRTADGEAGADGPGEPGGQDGPDGDYRTEEFSFIEEENEESEDVIDWLKFSESRTERREEAKRRSRNRMTALLVVLAVALVGGVGFLWYAGKLPGLSGDDGADRAAGEGQQRRVIVVHLREVGSGEVSTALLVNNETESKGTTVLLPNSLVVSSSGGAGAATTLGRSFQAEGAAATRDGLGLLLGTEIRGTWRLDTPYLENWVELVGGITVDADTTVPGAKKGDKPLVEKGGQSDLDGRAAVAYATYRADGEPQTTQLARFGQVVHAALAKMSSDPAAATRTVEALAQIPDPSLTEAQLGASLAPLAGYAKKGAYTTALLPVEADGTLSDEASDGLVKKVLGGTVRNTDPSATPRVSLKDATGDSGLATTARVTLVNGGYTVVGGGRTDSVQETTRVTYADAADKVQAVEVAKTLGLSEKAVEEGRGAANADVTVVLGKDYRADGAGE
ncbi:MAG TPA: LytR C-terminal domain-containing protein [Streptomyces sp.]|nr:LytR C-terminal domain-containing protein [Streptomyces sp.]